MSIETDGAGAQSNGTDTCPRCGKTLTRNTTGRPRVWCSQTCRRAAYEERRAADAGAIAVRVVERIEIRELTLAACVDRTIESPTGCRRVVEALARRARDGELSDAQWESTRRAISILVLVSREHLPRRW